MAESESRVLHPLTALALVAGREPLVGKVATALAVLAAMVRLILFLVPQLLTAVVAVAVVTAAPT
jgi:hypothetical protein